MEKIELIIIIKEMEKRLIIKKKGFPFQMRN